MAKILGLQLQLQSSKEHSGLISLRMDWLDLFAVKGTLKSLLQHHSSKGSILLCSAFFSPTVTSIHDYRKTIALTRWTFVDKVMSLLFNTLSRLVITFLPRSKRLYFMAAVTICSDFGAQENKVSHCYSIYLPWNDGTGCENWTIKKTECRKIDALE